MEQDAVLITASELAKRLQVKTHTVKVWTRRGVIPALRLTSKVIRYNLNQVVEAIVAKQLNCGVSSIAPLRHPPRTLADLHRQAEQLVLLPDSPKKLALIHRLFVFCNGSKRFKQAFQDQLGEELNRLKAKWGLKNGKELLTEQINKNGGQQ